MDSTGAALLGSALEAELLLVDLDLDDVRDQHAGLARHEPRLTAAPQHLLDPVTGRALRPPDEPLPPAPPSAPRPVDVDPFTGLPVRARHAAQSLLPDREDPGEVLPPPVHAPVHPLVADLQAAVAALARAQAAGELASGSLLDTGALLHAAESVAGLAMVELAAVDRTKAYAGVGRASAAGWVGATLTITEAAARAKVSLARRLTEDLAAVGDLLVDGGTTVGHCAAMTAGLRGIRPDVVAASVPALVTLARVLDPTSLARELRERAHAVSDELAQEQAKRQRQRTGVTATELLDGCVSIHGLLAPEPGQALLAALDALVHGDRQARDEAGEPDDRDAPTRRADALATLAQHALGCDGLLPGHAGSRATVHVISSAEALAGETGATPAAFAGSNGLLTHAQLLRLTCDADISRVAIDQTGRTRGALHQQGALDLEGAEDPQGDSGGNGRATRRVLDLGRLTRTVNAAQYRALVARDQGCIVKGCRRRHSECQAHHVWHWALGGPSDLANYALVCHLHHHQLHEGGKTLQHRDGRWLTPTGYVDTGPPVL